MAVKKFFKKIVLNLMMNYFRRNILTHNMPSSPEVNLPDEQSELRCSSTINGTDTGYEWEWTIAYHLSCKSPHKQTISFYISMEAILESKINPQTTLM